MSEKVGGYAYQVSDRGQMTIDHTAREKLGVRPGMIAYQRVVDGHLEVIFLPAPHRRSLHGVLHRQGQEPRATTARELEEAVMDAIARDHEKRDENA
ncbi:MAG: AbrB family transcriptional regulator [Chloroflexi bacterium]|nr:AbrB family transcriptional regulator [Chloroflexota bacterium]